MKSTRTLCYEGREKRAVRERIARAVDHFIDIGTSSAYAAAQRIRDDGIDILVDLSGYTQFGCSRILAYRPAPIQVNFLGFPATMGAPFVDYIVADKVVIPRQEHEHYCEQIVYMPHCYQPNDRQKSIAEETPTRLQCGLPQQGFVFCCFNKSYKLTPFVFDIWMRLLNATQGSVLWLTGTHEAAMENLRREAGQRDVDAQRLVFAPRVDTVAEHLARHRHADLFLDTLPFNAHTTASDALWAGVPVVTCVGNTFAGRVGASLLQAIGMPELIAHTFEEYEKLALKLAHDPGLLAQHKIKLGKNRLSMPLFDSTRYTRDLESAYELMWAKHERGDLPGLIELPPEIRTVS